MGDADVTVTGSWTWTDETVGTHKVTYSWTNAPAGTYEQTLPGEITDLVKGQGYTIDTKYTAGYKVQSQDAYGNNNGYWTFSGWTDPNSGTMGDADVTVTGSWTFTETEKFDIVIHFVDDAATPATLLADKTLKDQYKDSSYDVASEIPARISDYVKETVTGATSGTVTGNVEITVVYAKDVWKDADQTEDTEDEDSETGGDDIPDKYQVLVKYKSEDSNKGTVTPEYEVITLRNDDGTYVETANVIASGSTATPQDGYSFEKWTNNFGASEIANATTGEITIEKARGGETYTFTANFVRKSTPSYNPPVAPKLNKADHYAYVVGYPDGTVQPQGAITRAEVATIFFRLLSDETRDLYWTKDNAYTDVKAGDWFNNAVSTLSNAGIINGYPDGTFRPNAPITRAEMAKVIAMFAELNKDSEGFKDIAGHWAEAYIKLAAGNGWITGYPDGTFRPNQYITRAETMTMINRVLERVPSTEKHLLAYEVMLTFPDNQPGDWYYIAVQEATNSHTYERYATEKNGDEQWIKLIDNYDWKKLEF